MRNHKPILYFTTAMLCAAISTPMTAHEAEADSIYPQHELSEVVVTSYKTHHRNLTPVSVSTLGRAELQSWHTTDISDLSAMIPSLYIPLYGSRQTMPIAIRGVMSKVKSTAVGFYVDGMPHFETSAFNADMLDVKAIEVYRGPQGTLYGRNTIGGVIQIHTLTPFDQQGTKVRVGYGNYGNLTVQAAHHSLLSSRAGLSVSGYYDHGSGYFSNVTLGRKADKLDAAGGRMAFYLNPGDRWKLRLSTHLDYTHQGGYPYAAFDPATRQVGDVSYNRACGYRRIISTTGLMARYEADTWSMNSQTTFQHLHDNQRVDQDFSSADIYFVGNGVTQNIWNEEVIFKSEGNGRFQWIAGLNAFAMTSHQDQSTHDLAHQAIKANQYNNPTQGAAVFAQLSYNLWRGLSATAGLRLDYEHSRMTQHTYVVTAKAMQNEHTSFEGTLHFTQLIPKVGLQYLFGQRNQVFANVTRGYKTGAFNQSFTKPEEMTYDPEYNWNYEVGTKLGTADGRLYGELTLYYIDWRHQHISHLVPGLGNIIDNAGHSDSKGVELSLTARPLRDLLIQGTYGYTYARFLDYRKSEKQDYSGRMLPLVPRHTMSVNAQYTIRPRRLLDLIRLSANLTGTGKLYWNEDNQQAQPFYALLGSKVAAQKGRVTVELWGKNLTSTDYLAYYFTSSKPFAQKGMPLTLGASVTVSL